MPELYNTSWMDNVTGFQQVFTGIGDSIGQPYLIGHLLMLAFFVVFFIVNNRNNPDPLKALVYDGFLTTLISILLFSISMIPVTSILFPTIIFFLSLLFYLFS